MLKRYSLMVFLIIFFSYSFANIFQVEIPRDDTHAYAQTYEVPLNVKAQKSRLTVYVWHGYRSPGVLRNPDFLSLFRRSFRGQQFIFNDLYDKHGKEQILQMLPKVDIVYVNTHSGYLKRTDEHVIQVGQDAYSDDGRISARDFANLRQQVGDANLPRLIVISGCDILGAPPSGSLSMTIPEALGFRPNMKGRALMGYGEIIPGLRSDRYFRVFFALWTAKRQDGKYRTLREATKDAKQFIINWIEKHAPNEDYMDYRRAHYMNRLDANTANKLIILGDSDLRFPDLLQPHCVQMNRQGFTGPGGLFGGTPPPSLEGGFTPGSPPPGYFNCGCFSSDGRNGICRGNGCVEQPKKYPGMICFWACEDASGKRVKIRGIDGAIMK